jgi:hypothetical protein
MKSDKLVPGAILVLLGVVFLLDNFHVINFDWMNLLYLWPIFLIMGGISLVFAGNRSPLATVLKLAVVVGCFALLVFGNFGKRYHFWPNAWTFHSDDYNNDSDDDDSDTTNTDQGVVKIGGDKTFKEEYSAGIKHARLNISGGGTIYNLSDSTADLFSAQTQELYGKYTFNHSKDDSVYVLNLNLKNNKGFHFDSNDQKNNKADIKLNTNPVWDIDVTTGATDLNFDLSKFKIKTLSLKGGAASFDVKLGAPVGTTNVEVSTGASEVTIRVPKGAACRITSNTGLSSNEFEGFSKKSDNDYETDGFDAAKNRILIHMSGGISDFKVNRY